MSLETDRQGHEIVQLDKVTVRYGSRVALNNVSLSVSEGIVGLLGPNGAGKSTLLKTLLGFCKPTSGVAQVLGNVASRGGREVRRRVGYMPERDVTSPKLSAVSFVSYCGTLAGMPYRDSLQRTHEVLNYVGFGEERYRAMETYSTGMRQRAKLAQALVHDPRVLFLDEPTNGLDPVGRIAMLDLIKDVARIRGVAVLLSSHLLPDVEHVCERVVLMDQGRIVREGTIAALTQLRQDRYAVRVREGISAFEEKLREAGCLTEIAGDGKVEVRLPAGKAPADVFRLARSWGFQVRDVVPVRHRLEDVFMEALANAKSAEKG
ncbi:MAG TPA: ABC transporter ATP-binding protein [Candidatus Hydrogenedentes bacterium]|nr:ABC transporter ATP-binding protein [Candidatus Hydrogenedentota bacterium]HRK34356.1 ABC transporter ATP-binding protein [Candidatus Hydrogenedentota bacterium]